MRVEGMLWSSQDKLNEHVHQFLLVMLKRNTIVKNKVLTWIGGCLKYNVERGKLWNMHQVCSNFFGLRRFVRKEYF